MWKASAGQAVSVRRETVNFSGRGPFVGTDKGEEINLQGREHCPNGWIKYSFKN